MAVVRVHSFASQSTLVVAQSGAQGFTASSVGIGPYGRGSFLATSGAYNEARLFVRNGTVDSTTTNLPDADYGVWGDIELVHPPSTFTILTLTKQVGGSHYNIAHIRVTAAGNLRLVEVNDNGVDTIVDVGQIGADAAFPSGVAFRLGYCFDFATGAVRVWLNDTKIVDSVFSATYNPVWIKLCGPTTYPALGELAPVAVRYANFFVCNDSGFYSSAHYPITLFPRADSFNESSSWTTTPLWSKLIEVPPVNSVDPALSILGPTGSKSVRFLFDELLPSNVRSIKCVDLRTWILNAGPGTLTSSLVMFDSEPEVTFANGNITNGSFAHAGAGASYVPSTIGGTDTAWTVAAVNALEAGVRNTDAANDDLWLCGCMLDVLVELAPTIDTIAPDETLNRTTPRRFTVAGNYFEEGMTVFLDKDEMTDSINGSVVSVTPTAMVVEFELFDADPGIYDLNIFTTEDIKTTLADALTVKAHPPPWAYGREAARRLGSP